MVNIKGMTKGNTIPSAVTGLIAANTILNGSGGAGWSTQSFANIIARIGGPFNAGGFSSSQAQTIVGSPGFKFQLKQEIITGAILLGVDYAMGEVKAAKMIPYAGKIRRFILRPVGAGLLLGGFVNIVLGDPAGPTTNLGNIGQSAGRTQLGAYTRTVSSTGTGFY